MKSIICFVTLLILSIGYKASAQSLEKRIMRKAEQRANRKIDRTIDKGLDEVEKGIDESTKGDNKNASKKESSGKSSQTDNTTGQKDAGVKEKTTASTPAFKEYTKFDFVSGDKVVAYEDFKQDAVGDFPAKWNTNSSAEVVTFEGQEGHWLALTTSGIVTPDFISTLPDNFTLEFDLQTTPGYSYYDSWFSIHLLAAPNKKDVVNWNAYRGKRSGIEVLLHPQDAGNGPEGRSRYEVMSNGRKTMDNTVSQLRSFNAKDKTYARISIWRQKQRLRVYVNETKLWDLPRAFEEGNNYNTVVFEKENSKEGNRYYISNVRLAHGLPDTRNKLLTDGKFVTTGIYFNTNSAQLKPESYGVLKEIADVLRENPDVNILIVGHTDSDGDDAHNLDLSKKRSLSVKQALVSEFGIADARMKTDGKGESQPVSGNTSSEGKAANRRVEFIRQ